MIYDLAFGGKTRLSISFQDAIDELPAGESIASATTTVHPVGDTDLTVADGSPAANVASLDVTEVATSPEQQLYKLKTIGTTTPSGFKIPRTNYVHVQQHVPTVSSTS